MTDAAASVTVFSWPQLADEPNFDGNMLPSAPDDGTMDQILEGNPSVQDIGTVDPSFFEDEFGKLQTNEVILTNEREAHIKGRHPQDYSLFEKYGADVIKMPDVVLRDDKNEGTAFMIKKLPDSSSNLNVVLRLALETDNGGRKNSVMTFYRIRESNLKKLIARNKTLYTRR